eukprot:CAMPEP_0180820604 /NCGR_PEP_ID=MMETSP1038_2-20121128/70374_1 /TAXON_ID=632150 /ORGANISM="Azadinium spinosum, Strain 3D9" /LENGTH=54 /DNA_ID=CAMNT_0022862707 /DNA_START=323 /DNA_END=483 /DNA_ORIENTATION=+
MPLCVEAAIGRRQRLELQRVVCRVGTDRDNGDLEPWLPKARVDLRQLRHPPGSL